MLRALAAIGLIGLLFSNVFLKSFVLLDFKIHQAAISKTVCVQKDEVKNTCNGKCHLGKQLEKTEDDAEKAPVIPKTLHEILLFFKATEIEFKNDFGFDQALNPNISNLNGIEFPRSTFRPPPSVLS